ncbi:MAG: ABC transporter substrate-binding protein [Alphaproteobacteria bacterium]|nr:ABC transporter substrate-binding protein [Alphaproteobacteria bacterium]
MYTRRLVGGLIASAAVAFILQAAPPAAQSAMAASEHAEGAKAFLQSLADRTITTLNQKQLDQPQRIDAFRHLFAEGFDVPSIGQFVAGRAWTKATEPQKIAYLKVFEEVTILTWALRFEQYSGEKLSIEKIREDGKAVLLESLIVRPGKESIRVDWRIEKGKNGYKILDIVAEGTSLAIAQRADYTAVIQQSNGEFDGLIRALRDKQKKLRQQAKLEN